MPLPVLAVSAGGDAVELGDSEMGNFILLPPALLIALAIFLLHLLAGVAAHFQNRKTSAEVAAEARVAAVRAEVARLSPVADFVKKSKLERELVRLEKELAQLRGEGDHWDREGSRLPPARGGPDVAHLLTRRTLPLLCAAAAALCWGSPVLRVPDKLLWPLGWALARGGGMGALAWCAACNSVAGRLVASLPLQTKKRGEEGGILGSILGMLKQE